MSTPADGNGTNQSNVTTVENLLKRNSDDVGWKYEVLVDPNNKDRVRCKICTHESSGGAHRLKEHVAGVGKNVKKCRDAPAEAKEKCKKSLDESKRKRKEKTVRELELRQEVNVSRVEGGDEVEVTCVGSSQPHKLGPIDKWTRAIDPKATSSESLKQQKMNKALWQERTREVQKYIARWVYTHAIPFYACDNDEFKQMCEAIGQFGPLQ